MSSVDTFETLFKAALRVETALRALHPVRSASVWDLEVKPAILIPTPVVKHFEYVRHFRNLLAHHLDFDHANVPSDYLAVCHYLAEELEAELGLRIATQQFLEEGKVGSTKPKNPLNSGSSSRVTIVDTVSPPMAITIADADPRRSFHATLPGLLLKS